MNLISEILYLSVRIYSASGNMPAHVALMTKRPVRTPHHTASGPALVGGGTIPQAGEVSLANHGILFLDEFPEFMRSILETLRQPLEDGFVTVSRAHSSVQFPAKCMLVAAMNPCPCGYFGSESSKPCKCSPTQIGKYLSRVSGPLIDRIDIHIEVPVVPFHELRSKQPGTGSSEMREKVLRAREKQRERFGHNGCASNARMSAKEVRENCKLDSECEGLLRQAMTQLSLSARAHDKILKIARTISDLEESESIQQQHLTEAVHYRRLDRQL